MSVLVLAFRVGIQSDDTVELLCLRAGDRGRFRLYLSTLDLDLRERSDDVEGVEFESADDEEVWIFLIESMWFLHIEPRDLKSVESTNLIASGVAVPLHKSHENGVIDALLHLAEQQLIAVGNTSLSVFAISLGVKITTTVEQLPLLTPQQLERLRGIRSCCSVLRTALDATSESVLARQHQKP